MNQSPNKTVGIWRILTVAAQLLVGAVFIFSGIVKCVDPWGTAIKLQEYFLVFGFAGLTHLALVFSWTLALLEFLIGFHLFVGQNRRLAVWLCAIFMLVFTPLTLYLALTNPISDCGCFGDAVVLSNWATFYKNLILLAATAVLLWRHREMAVLCQKPYCTLYRYWVLVFAIWLCYEGTMHLPYIDFRPYRPGVNITEAMQWPGEVQGGEEAVGADMQYVFVYSRDGVEQEFPIDALPDEAEGWEFVDRREVSEDSESAKQGTFAGAAAQQEPLIKDFFVLDEQGNDYTPELLTDTNYTFLLISANLETAREHDVDKIESIYEYAIKHDYGFVCLTSRHEEAVDRWRDRTGARYPMYYSDITIIETMLRANPGLMLIKEGTILWKTSLPKFEVEALTSVKLSEQTYGKIMQIDRQRRIFKLAAWLFAPFALYLLNKFVMTLRCLGMKRRCKNNTNQ